MTKQTQTRPQYSALVRFESLNDKKLPSDYDFVIIGTDSGDIIKNASKYGTGPYFVGGMQLLNPDWNV